MVCTVFKDYGIVPVQARGAWVTTRAVDNSVKTTKLLKEHQNSEWHLAAMKKRALN